MFWKKISNNFGKCMISGGRDYYKFAIQVFFSSLFFFSLLHSHHSLKKASSHCYKGRFPLKADSLLMRTCLQFPPSNRNHYKYLMMGKEDQEILLAVKRYISSLPKSSRSNAESGPSSSLSESGPSSSLFSSATK